jgi:transposase
MTVALLPAFVLRTGIAWQQLPQELGYGSGMTGWRHLNWSQTTKSPRARSARSAPEAHGPRIRRAPSSRIAHTFAR